MTETRIQRIPSTTALPAALRGGVVAIGNFDGVHRGHQAVLERALDEARRKNVPALVLTFEPHPRETFRPDTPLFRLTTAPVRARLLEALGFDGVVEQHFDQEFSACTATQFVERVLLKELGISHVVTGYDFHFGKGREGTPAFLLEQGNARGFGVTLVDAFCDEGSGVISSSRIRGLLTEGDVTQAAGLLGYRYTVMAEISHGKKLGRELGFPTANMELAVSNSLKHGIYAVRLRRPDGSLHDGVASFGRRPTVDDDGAPLLETFVFDFSDSLYGECCSVSFFGYLRGEVKFDGLDPLIVQMKRDEEEARALLSGVTPLSEIDLKIAF
ncbi:MULTISPECIES: bifunctional riboflavin kinase/FAD synthetase [unclassified Aminobacter]|uniref:bifunctional riboflavin kinase/FAD synthetase n=1 Tax=unclassified Aminobacter TaxID=2644704 RepID=UPI000463420C|nr:MULTISPECIES: bifunctional riboflavin kinase/FAD synthetase [unclassified Aminobacter]TWH34038.1 riboflavin kinase/FMN adenylyltransferase [Aminobacter sp. J15]